MTDASERPIQPVLAGILIGDVAGSTREGKYDKRVPDRLIETYSHFTDDTYLACAVADGLLQGIAETGREGLADSPERQEKVVLSIARSLKQYGRAYGCRGCGGGFKNWAWGDSLEGYNSYGNGAAMRAGFAGWYATTLEEAELFGKLSARPTHNHPDAEEAASVVAGCIFILKTGGSKQDVLTYAGKRYDLNFTLDAIRPIHAFNITAKGTLIAAIACFLESASFAECIGLAVSLGGDSDTLAAIAGGIAEAHYRIEPDLLRAGLDKLDERLANTMRRATEALIAESLWRPGARETSTALVCECSWPDAKPDAAPDGRAEAVSDLAAAPEFPVLLGAVIGDMAGAPFEGKYEKRMPDALLGPNSRFTDETVLVCAVAEGIMAGIEQTGRDGLADSPQRQEQMGREIASAVRRHARAYRRDLPGDKFHSGFDNYRRFTSSAAARAAFAGWYAATLEEARLFGRLSAQASYDTPGPITAAEVVAECVFILKEGGDKADALRLAQKRYNLNCTLDALRPMHAFNITSRGVMPVALLCFLESTSFAHCIGLALSMGGDCDTVTAIAGALAEAYYRIDPDLARAALAKLDAPLAAILAKATERLEGRRHPVGRETAPALRCECKLREIPTRGTRPHHMHQVGDLQITRDFHECMNAAERLLDGMLRQNGPAVARMSPESGPFPQAWQECRLLYAWLNTGLPQSPFMQLRDRPCLNPHLSFIWGNQIFLVRLEDADSRCEFPGTREDLLRIAENYKGSHACILPMRRVATGVSDGHPQAHASGFGVSVCGITTEWRPALPEWGLVDLQSGKAINPPDLVTNERIPMSDWERYCFAVLVVRERLRRQGNPFLYWGGDPAESAAFWVNDKGGRCWVIVRVAREPVMMGDFWPDPLAGDIPAGFPGFGADVRLDGELMRGEPFAYNIRMERL